jgi:hypothetical protein
VRAESTTEAGRQAFERKGGIKQSWVEIALVIVRRVKQVDDWVTESWRDGTAFRLNAQECIIHFTPHFLGEFFSVVLVYDEYR